MKWQAVRSKEWEGWRREAGQWLCKPLLSSSSYGLIGLSPALHIFLLSFATVTQDLSLGSTVRKTSQVLIQAHRGKKKKKGEPSLPFISESLFACQYKPLAIVTYTSAWKYYTQSLSLQASSHTVPAQKPLPHPLPFKLCCIVNVTIYTHDILLHFYYMKRSLPRHTFYTFFPFLKNFCITAVTILVILLYSLPQGGGTSIQGLHESLSTFLQDSRESHCVNTAMMSPMETVFPLSQPTRSQQIPSVGDQYGVRRPLPPVPTNQNHCAPEKIPGSTVPKQLLSPTYLCPIRQPGNHLRCHPVWGTHQ